MNRREATMSLVKVGVAILAPIVATIMSIPTQAIATSQAYQDASYLPGGRYVEDVTDSSGTSDDADKEAEVFIGEDITTDPTKDEDEDEKGAEDSNDSSNDREDSHSLGYDALQECLVELGDSPTEQEVQDCMKSSYGGQDSNEHSPSESPDEEGEGETRIHRDILQEDKA